jgi:hypothetical protein
VGLSPFELSMLIVTIFASPNLVEAIGASSERVVSSTNRQNTLTSIDAVKG